MLGHTRMSTDIGGHEGVCHVVKSDLSVDLEKRVRVRWLHTYCIACEMCAVDVTTCPKQQNSGRDVPSTSQQYTVSPVEGLSMIPEVLDDVVAAPLLCASSSMYGSISRACLNEGEWLVLLDLMVAWSSRGANEGNGLKLIAIDTGKLTKGYGAYTVICTAGLGAYAQAIRLLRNCGTLVCVGLVTEKLPVCPPSTFKLKTSKCHQYCQVFLVVWGELNCEIPVRQLTSLGILD